MVAIAAPWLLARAKASSRNGLGAVVWWCGLAMDSVADRYRRRRERGGEEGGRFEAFQDRLDGLGCRWLVAGHKCGPDDGGADRGLPAWVVQRLQWVVATNSAT